MTKLKNPLLSLGAVGRLGNAISYKRRGKQFIAQLAAPPMDVKSLAQLSWRHMYLKAVALWHALSAAEKQEWETLARRKHMTGFAWFMSQCLRPNPGIYLPLQGGTMQGDILMGDHSILELPVPSADQEAATKKYVDDAAVAGYTEGARVTHSAHQAIANDTWTYPALDTEIYDTDDIHDNVTNNSRLTCKTAGKYMIVGQGRYPANATGVRGLYLKLNRTENLSGVELAPHATYATLINVPTIYALEVNDYIEIFTYQNSGGALHFEKSGDYAPVLAMQRIG